MSNEEQGTNNTDRNRLIIGVIAAVAIIAIVVLSILTYIKTVSDENTISTLHDQLVSLQSQFSSARAEIGSIQDKISEANTQISDLGDREAADIASLRGDLTSASDDITSLTSQINGALFQISNLQSDISSDSGIVASIQSQLSSLNSQLTSLSNTSTSLQNTLTALETTVDSLAAQVEALTTSTSSPTTLFTSKFVSQSFNTESLLHTFVPATSGNIYVTGVSNSSTGYIRITNNTTAGTNVYAFGTGSTITAPVTGGYSYSIIFGNTEVAGTITANLSATYYPTTTPGTNSVNLLTSYSFSQGFGTQTLLTTFPATYNGYIYITGTSSSATGYIRITNNTTAVSTNHAFGTGAAISIAVTAGQSYSITFGNTEASGVVTATLTATYYY